MLFFLMEVLLRQIPNDYSLKYNYLEHNGGSIQVLILGSSHAYWGVNPAFMSLKGFNAAYSSQDFFYDRLLFDKFLNRLTNLKYLIVPISYFSMTGKLKETIEPWRAKNYVIYYGILFEPQVADFSEMLTFRLGTNIERLYSYYIKGESPETASKLGWGTDHKSGGDPNLLEDGISASKRHTADLDKEKLTIRQNVENLNEMAAEANKRGIKVILFTPPAYKTYVERLNERQLKLMRTSVDDLMARYPNIQYVDYLTDTAFVKEDFYDSDHLNEIGAEKLTRMLDGLMDTK